MIFSKHERAQGSALIDILSCMIDVGDILSCMIDVGV